MTIPRRRFEVLGANIEKIIKPILGRRGFSVGMVVTNWKEIVGGDLARHTIPEQITYPSGSRSNGILRIRINSSALALELQHLEPQLKEKINGYYGFNAIQQIRIIQGPLPRVQEKAPKEDISLTQNENMWLEKKLENVSDRNLRDALSALGSALKRDRK